MPRVLYLLQSQDVRVQLGEVEVEVDPTIDDTIDEVGRATVKFAIPEIAGLGGDPETWGLLFLDDLGHTGFGLDISIKAGVDVTPPDNGDEDGDGEDETMPPPSDPGDGKLPDTGADITGPLVAAAIMLAVGGTALAVRRRHLMS